MPPSKTERAHEPVVSRSHVPTYMELLLQDPQRGLHLFRDLFSKHIFWIRKGRSDGLKDMQ